MSRAAGAKKKCFSVAPVLALLARITGGTRGVVDPRIKDQGPKQGTLDPRITDQGPQARHLDPRITDQSHKVDPSTDHGSDPDPWSSLKLTKPPLGSYHIRVCIQGFAPLNDQCPQNDQPLTELGKQIPSRRALSDFPRGVKSTLKLTTTFWYEYPPELGT